MYDPTPSLYECAYAGNGLCLHLLSQKALLPHDIIVSQPDILKNYQIQILKSIEHTSFFASNEIKKPDYNCDDITFPTSVVNYLKDAKDASGNSILHWAAKSNQVELLSCLLSRFAEVSSQNNTLKKQLLSTQNDAGSTILHWAVTSVENIEVLSYILLNTHTHNATAANFSVDMKDHFINLTNPYLDAESITNKQNQLGETPLHWAVEWNNFIATRALLLQGANPMIKDIYGNTPLHKISSECDEDPICRNIYAMLIKFGAIVTEENNYKRTPLQHFDLKSARPPTDFDLGFEDKVKRYTPIICAQIEHMADVECVKQELGKLKTLLQDQVHKVEVSSPQPSPTQDMLSPEKTLSTTTEIISANVQEGGEGNLNIESKASQQKDANLLEQENSLAQIEKAFQV